MLVASFCCCLIGCKAGGPIVDTDGRTAAEVFRLFLDAVEADDYRTARTYWGGEPNIANGGGKGKFSDVCDWWKEFSEVRIVRTTKGKMHYYHVWTECYKGTRKEAWPHVGCFLDDDGRWKFARNIWW